jgi:hypothetical protein
VASDPLDEELRKDGIEMIAPHCSNRTSLACAASFFRKLLSVRLTLRVDDGF